MKRRLSMKQLTKISLCILTAFMSITTVNAKTPSNPEPVWFFPDFSEDEKLSDWDLTCDNVGACRAVGFYGEESFDYEDENQREASLMIKREAGNPKVIIKANLNFIEDPDYVVEETIRQMEQKSAEMFINGKSYGKVALNFENGSKLNDVQTKAILDNIKQPLKIEFRLDKMHSNISTYGLKEVLMKMDEIQGFANTPYALWQKGNKSAPTTTYSYPVLQDKSIIGTSSAIDRNSNDGKKLIALLKNDLKVQAEKSEIDYQDDCMILDDDSEIDEYDKERIQTFDAVQLTKDKKLVSGLCWTAAYNMGYGMWVVDNKFNKVHQNVGLDLSYQEGNQLFLAIKGRGLGDCWSLDEWTWDGEKFVQSFSGSTGMCRGFAGGAWLTPSTVIDVASVKDDISRFD